MRKLIDLVFIMFVFLVVGCNSEQGQMQLSKPMQPVISQEAKVTLLPDNKSRNKYLSDKEMFWKPGYEPILQSMLNTSSLIDNKSKGDYALVQREDYLLILTYLKIASVEDLEISDIDNRHFTIVPLNEYTSKNSNEIAYVEVETGLAYIFVPTNGILEEQEILESIKSIGIKSDKYNKNAVTK